MYCRRRKTDTHMIRFVGLVSKRHWYCYINRTFTSNALLSEIEKNTTFIYRIYSYYTHTVTHLHQKVDVNAISSGIFCSFHVFVFLDEYLGTAQHSTLNKKTNVLFISILPFFCMTFIKITNFHKYFLLCQIVLVVVFYYLSF